LNASHPKAPALFLRDDRSLGVGNIDGPNSLSQYNEHTFLQYFTNIHYRRFLARDAGKNQELIKYEKWLSIIKDIFRQMYRDKALDFVPMESDFAVRLSSGHTFGMNQMARGYELLLCTFSAIMGEMDRATDNACDYSLPYIVFIDELETHLHVELQKWVLPFLTNLFPNTQFIVTTHSPFVITSLENSVVYDLERREQLENPWIYSYESVIEAFLDTDMYSAEIKDRLRRYKELYLKSRTPEETKAFARVKAELELVPPASREIYMAFHTLERERKAAGNGKAN
jgi:hypothetical protein